MGSRAIEDRVVITGRTLSALGITQKNVSHSDVITVRRNIRARDSCTVLRRKTQFTSLSHAVNAHTYTRINALLETIV